jgi:DNA-binding CsgD family transcriptional regulator
MLTPRQRQALDMILTGMTAGEAAEHLAISERTMEVHRRMVFDALDARNVAELVRMVTVAGY